MNTPPETDTVWSHISMANNIEQMVECLSLFHDKDFQFDMHHAYFARTTPLLRTHDYSTLKNEFLDAFAAAASGHDGRGRLTTLWCNWVE